MNPLQIVIYFTDGPFLVRDHCFIYKGIKIHSRNADWLVSIRMAVCLLSNGQWYKASDNRGTLGTTTGQASKSAISVSKHFWANKFRINGITPLECLTNKLARPYLVSMLIGNERFHGDSQSEFTLLESSDDVSGNGGEIVQSWNKTCLKYFASNVMVCD